VCAGREIYEQQAKKLSHSPFPVLEGDKMLLYAFYKETGQKSVPEEEEKMHGCSPSSAGAVGPCFSQCIRGSHILWHPVRATERAKIQPSHEVLSTAELGTQHRCLARISSFLWRWYLPTVSTSVCLLLLSSRLSERCELGVLIP